MAIDRPQAIDDAPAARAPGALAPREGAGCSAAEDGGRAAFLPREEWAPPGFPRGLPRGVVATRGRKLPGRHCGKAIEASAVLRPDQAIKRPRGRVRRGRGPGDPSGLPHCPDSRLPAGKGRSNSAAVTDRARRAKPSAPAPSSAGRGSAPRQAPVWSSARCGLPVRRPPSPPRHPLTFHRLTPAQPSPVPPGTECQVSPASVNRDLACGFVAGNLETGRRCEAAPVRQAAALGTDVDDRLSLRAPFGARSQRNCASLMQSSAQGPAQVPPPVSMCARVQELWAHPGRNGALCTPGLAVVEQRDAELARLVGQVVGDAGAGEHHDADRHDAE